MVPKLRAIGAPAQGHRAAYLLPDMKRRTLAAFVLLCAPMQLPAQTRTFTHADTLRGSYTTSARAWWDVTFYDLRVTISPTDSSIRGSNGISYRVLQPASEMQIDLMVPLEVDSMAQDGQAVPFRRDGNAFFARLAAPQPAAYMSSRGRRSARTRSQLLKRRPISPVVRAVKLASCCSRSCPAWSSAASGLPRA